MSRSINWYYFRKGWTSCKKASDFMDAHRLVPDDVVPASRKLGREDAAELAAKAKTVIVAKGKKLDTFKVTKKQPSDETVDAMLGPTGNLRAPTIRNGKTVVVGYNDDGEVNIFGASIF